MTTGATQFRLPPYVETHLDNGLTVLWVEHREHPALSLALQVPSGTFHDPVGREGTADLAAALLGKGTQDLSPRRYAETLEQMGASTFTDADDEYTIIGARGLSRCADALVPLFWDTVVRPGMDEQEFKRLRRELLTSLQAELVEPGSIAHRHFYGGLYGKTHPAGRMHTVASVRRVSLEVLRDHARRHFSPQGSCLVVIGDVDVARRRAEWEPLFSSWQSEGMAQREPVPAPQAIDGTSIRLVDKPGLTQASLMIGHTTPGEASPEKLPLALANYILGGGNFSSRLMARLRSEGGQTYGVSSQISWNRAFGTFSIGTSTQNARCASTLRTIFQVYRTYAAEGPTDGEVDKAKHYAIGNMAFQLEGIGNIADKLLWLQFYGRDARYLEGFAGAVRAVSRDTVHDAIRRHLSSQHFAVTVVGPKAELLSQLSEFGRVDVTGFRSDP